MTAHKRKAILLNTLNPATWDTILLMVPDAPDLLKQCLSVDLSLLTDEEIELRVNWAL